MSEHTIELCVRVGPTNKLAAAAPMKLSQLQCAPYDSLIMPLAASGEGGELLTALGHVQVDGRQLLQQRGQLAQQAG